jgi:hypothetical protein
MERRLSEPRPQPDQPPHGGGSNNPESQPRPGVWNILEIRVRLDAPDVEDHPSTQGILRVLGELNRLEDEIREKGTAREKLILDLFYATTTQPTLSWPSHRPVSLEEFKQLRSRAEPLSEEELSEEIRKAKEEQVRKWEEEMRTWEEIRKRRPH